MTGPAVSQRVPLGVANGAAGLDSAGRLLPAELPSSAVTGDSPGLQKMMAVRTPALSLKANGCKGDGKYVQDAAITAQTAALSSASAAFTGADAGKLVLVVGAGAPTSVGTTSAALATGAAITSIPVNALAAAIPQGNILIFSADGTQSQMWKTVGAAAAATSIPVTSQTPNFAFASGSTIGYQECLSTTIASVAGGVATLVASAAISVTGAIACYGTDDTAAIQAVFDALGSNGQGGNILGEDGVYCVGGALKTSATSGNNTGALTYRSQIALPAQNINQAPELVITLEGGKAPGGDPTLITGLQTAGVIFQSFLVGLTAGGSNQLPSMIGGPVGELGGGGAITNVCFEARNVTFRCPSNPSITGANFQKVERITTRDVRFDTTEVPAAYNIGPYPMQPVHPTGHGLVLPSEFCQNGRCHGDLFITGYYAALRLGEHSAVDYVYCLDNYVAIGWDTCAHASMMLHANVEHNTYVLARTDPTAGIAVGSGNAGAVYINIMLLDIEDTGTSEGPYWSTVVNHIYDPQNRCQGKINFHRVQGGTGAVGSPTALSEFGNTQLVIENDGRSVRGGGLYNQVTTGVSAGGAVALPATPALYFQVKDAVGNTRYIPAY
jgi:hypothetical protein